MATTNRPMSPHLQVYRPQISSVLSILHRATGIALTIGTLLLVYWLIAAASGPESFADAQGVVGSLLGQILLFGWSYSLFYHLLSGIRHLAWDTGWGFDIPTMERTGWIVVAGSAALTLIAWIAAYIVFSGA
jgi:succinate dehydrogenase / fumarate reductase cytochrome b subunit